MIAINYDDQDAYSRYGADHFIRRSGIPFRRGGSGGKSWLQYGGWANDHFTIKLQGNKIEDKICGQVSAGNTSIPLCEIPKNTGDGVQHIAFFSGEEGTYPCVSAKPGCIDFGIDVFQETGHLLSGHFDKLWGALDDAGHDLVASRPSADILEDLLVAAVLEGCRDRDIPLIRKSFWPDAKKFAVCLTHDVDEVKKTYQWITRPARCLKKGDLQGLKCQLHSLIRKIRGTEPYWTFNEIAAIEKKFDAKSTFFFLKESGKPLLLSPGTWNLFGRSHSFEEPGVIDAIRVVSGYDSEVAVHGSFYSYSTPGLIKKETGELEEIIREKVTGIRQHHLNLLVPETWDYQRDAGLSYDTTLGYKSRPGFRWGTSYPFFPFTGTTAHAIREIPLTIMDITVLHRNDPLADCLAYAREVERVQGVLTLLWHPPIFNALEFPGAGELYSRIIERSMERDAWVTSAKEIAEWQKDRDSLDFSIQNEGGAYSVGLDTSGHDGYLSVYLPGHSAPEFSDNAKVLLNERDPVMETEWFHIRARSDEKTTRIVVNFT